MLVSCMNLSSRMRGVILRNASSPTWLCREELEIGDTAQLMPCR